MDLIREILLAYEAHDPSRLKSYDLKTLVYHKELLLEAGFVDGSMTPTVNAMGIKEPASVTINWITWQGHEFLSAVRHPSGLSANRPTGRHVTRKPGARPPRDSRYETSGASRPPRPRAPVDRWTIAWYRPRVFLRGGSATRAIKKLTLPSYPEWGRDGPCDPTATGPARDARCQLLRGVMRPRQMRDGKRRSWIS